MKKYLVQPTNKHEQFAVIPVLKNIPVERGDSILIDKIVRGNKTGKKEFVIVAGFTCNSSSNIPITMWYGDPEYIAKERKFVVFGRPWTEEFQDGIIKIEMPKNY